ncbi:T9SS type B sorting domain-containing protein [Polluticaenibacter yanchengensis]|uniref:Gliding motility-associated C-terminal domain-containing protein n=1 Tax=Polluticaenibacter yanchengensis TaxID=3014562 RepID=A0ABT4UK05_9BACT|nr:gliding motility-associated C-terminal domain-containing protein [Chitinophagaceae bacterium LY-5]
MKKVFFLLVLLCVWGAGMSQVFPGSTGTVPATGSSTFTANVSGIGVINASNGLESVTLNMTHTKTADLDIYLQSPNGMRVSLILQNIKTGANFTNTVLSGNATTSIKEGTPPYSGTFLPDAYLGSFNDGQNANGTWRLVINDRRNSSGGAGVVTGWSLKFSTTPSKQPPVLPSCNIQLPSGNRCTDAPTICDFSALCGDTKGSTNTMWSGSGIDDCFGVQNNTFIKFVASATSASFAVWVHNSTSSNYLISGIQMIIMKANCGSGAVTSYGCYEHIFPYASGHPVANIVKASNLQVGETYFLMFDGFSSDKCEFTVTAVQGVNILNVDPVSASICEGQSVELNASGGSGNFTWAPGTSLNTTTGAKVIATPAATQKYTVTSTMVGVCPQTKEVTVTVNPKTTPVTGFSYTTPVCNSAGNLSPTLSGGFVTGGVFSATTGLSINPATGVVNVQASTPGSYTITYKVAAKDCVTDGESTATLVINSGTAPVTTFSYQTPVCNNAGALLPQLGTGFTTGGVFSAPSGLSINATTGEINVQNSTPGTYVVNYNLAATTCSPAGTGNANILITAVETPNTSFSYQTPVCANAGNLLPVTGSNFKTGGIFTAGAGLSVNPNTGEINVANSTPGTYTVTYNIAANGCNAAGQSQATILIQNNITPNTTFSYRSPVCLDGSKVTASLGSGFTTGGTFTAPAGVSLNTNTGEIDLGKSTAGTYTITYQVTASGCQTAGTGTAQIVIESTIKPEITFSYTSPVCQSGTNAAPIPANSNFVTGGVYSSTTGLSINAGTGIINASTSQPGTYTVTYAVSASGCTSAGTSTATIVITTSAPRPIVGFDYPADICANAVSKLYTPVPKSGFVTGGTYSAATGISVNATTGIVDITGAAPGSYIITYSLPAVDCYTASSITSTIIIKQPSTPVVDFTYNTPVCLSNGSIEPNRSTGFTTGGVFSATPALNINAQNGTINLATATAGNYTINYKITAGNCFTDAEKSFALVLLAKPATPVVQDLILCTAGDSVLLVIDNYDPALTYNWYDNSNLTTVLHSGEDYKVKVTGTKNYFITAANGTCTSNTEEAKITVLNSSDNFDLGKDTVICPGKSVILEGPSGYTGYTWSTGATTRIITVSAAGKYILTARTATGCEVKDSVTVYVAPNCTDLFFPNAFTPNGDGKNDYFGPIGNLADVRNYELLIYNRWGELVFQSKNPYIKWNGTHKGKPVPSGTFTWYARYQFGAIEKTQKGTIVIIR